jgi:2-oxoglutarate ferredoxin oxidoreductase subunit delta
MYITVIKVCTGGKMARKGKVVIDQELCKGCYLCVRACPVKVLEPDTELNASGCYPIKAVNTEKCIACGACYEVCPDVCIEIYELEESEV